MRRSRSIPASFSFARLYASTARSRFASSSGSGPCTLLRLGLLRGDGAPAQQTPARQPARAAARAMKSNRACRMQAPEDARVPADDRRTGRGPVRHEHGSLTTALRTNRKRPTKCRLRRTRGLAGLRRERAGSGRFRPPWESQVGGCESSRPSLRRGRSGRVATARCDRRRVAVAAPGAGSGAAEREPALAAQGTGDVLELYALDASRPDAGPRSRAFAAAASAMRGAARPRQSRAAPSRDARSRSRSDGWPPGCGCSTNRGRSTRSPSLVGATSLDDAISRIDNLHRIAGRRTRR